VMQELEELVAPSGFVSATATSPTHLYRTQRLSEGETKTESRAIMPNHWGVDVQVLP